MRTPAQQEASRINGSKSHGPVTPEGKSRVSQNGITHGIYSRRVVVKGEDPQAFDEMHQSLISQWNPVNDFEANLITDIAEARWRLARFLSLSTEALDLQMEMMRPTLAEDWPDVPTGTRYVLAFNEAISRNRTLEVLEAAIAKQHRIIQTATRQLIQLRKLRPDLAKDAVSSSSTTEPQEEQPAQPAASAEPAQTAASQPVARNSESKPEPARDSAPQTENGRTITPQRPSETRVTSPGQLPRAA